MDQYVQVKLLGKGTFGAAWLVKRKSDGAQFVAKEVKLGGMKKPERDSARNEISLLRTLNHPNITRYVDHYETRDSLFLIMEYANGGDLYQRIQSRRGMRLTEKEVLHYFVQICLALSYIHDHRILHRDLKSQNVFLTQDGIVKLGDFGISTVLRNTYELRRTVCGTPYYFSPELCLNKPYNNKSDVWALGCILYELTTLNHAFDAINMNQLIKKILRGVYPPIAPSYSRDLANLIAGMLNLDATKRPNVSTILNSAFILNSMSELHKNIDGAIKAKISCVSDDDKQKALLAAKEREEKEKQLRAVKEKALIEMQKEEKERREREREKRAAELHAQLEREQKMHEERLARLAEQKAKDEERKKELDLRNRARVEDEKKRRAAREGQQKQRELEWERNMKRLQEEREQQAQRHDLEWEGEKRRMHEARERQQQQRDQNLKMFLDARREAEANKARAKAEEEARHRQYREPVAPPRKPPTRPALWR